LPVVATEVGGQSEIRHPLLRLVPADSPAGDFAALLADLPVRAELRADAAPRFPRAWSLTTSWRRAAGTPLDTIFVTANLNAGGAQRSLVNLAGEIAHRHRFAIAVCGETTHPAFPACLSAAGVESFRPAATADPFEVAEGVLARATSAGARNVCFWNADARVKLLVARFAPPRMRLVDVSPGAYAYEELFRAGSLGQAIAFGPDDFHRRLDALVTKFDDRTHPPCRRVEVIPNGVKLRNPARGLPVAPRFLASGRIAPSKRLEAILEAFGTIATRFPGSRLDVVGQAEPRHRDYLASLMAMAGDLPVAFHGAAPGLEFLDEPFTALVVLGTNQGCPNAVLEAMAAGIAVIANDSGGTRELVRGGETGWLLPEACSVRELAEAMAEAAGDARHALLLGRAARSHVARHHSLDAMAVRYLSLFSASGANIGDSRDNATHAFQELRTA
jgi:glycosyltransferase involved in cell wall biosynthesis